MNLPAYNHDPRDVAQTVELRRGRGYYSVAVV